MSPHPRYENLVDFIYGGLDEPAALETQKHLGVCSPCRSLSARIAVERSALRDSLVSTPRRTATSRVAGRVLVAVAAIVFATVVAAIWKSMEIAGRTPDPAPPGTSAAGKQERPRSPVLEGLLWLARHQGDDGSWGRHVRGCNCPDNPPLPVLPALPRDPEVEKHVRALLEALDHDDPGERDKASAALRALGEKAGPYLEDSLARTDAEARARVMGILVGLRRTREPRPPVAPTAWALCAFLGAGYSQISRDIYEGICFGTVVKKAIRWMSDQQNADGSIGSPKAPDATLQHACGALALSEAYGMTADPALKEPARKAVAYLMARQSAAGGWHRGNPALPAEVLTSVFAGMALKSAELSELSPDAASLGRARAFIDKMLDKDGLAGTPPTRATVGGAVCVMILTNKKAKDDPRVVRAGEWLAGKAPRSDDPDFVGYQLASIGLFQLAGPEGALWKRWNQPMKEALAPTQADAKAGCTNGSWSPQGPMGGLEGQRVASTAMAVLTLEVFYRYVNAFGGK